MGRRETITYNHSIEVYKQPLARKVVLFVGFAVSLVSFAVCLIGVLAFFVGSVGDTLSSALSKTVLEVEKILCWVAIGASIGGTIFSVAGANACKPIARISFLFTILSMFTSLAILVLSYLGIFMANVIY